ncbi:helix-turn-helix domain-containing protein [Kaustia mangrovi]|uniref:Helix-turn-helix domain-containing protein n=1 Tax=Kaustia mangrovi TaxID=2593653 RepID=A0A7S8C1Z9_9HYPH|nr:IclR family transcriptional regulator C-terminal domain-containing protein [Kaustia mangrovi]QPC41914.1 helix-turn-helix domain-containing protein [Kaustia mangrovi]
MDAITKSPTEDEERRSEFQVPSKEVLRASGQVQSLSRALKLLNALSHHPQGLSLSEVAHEVGLPTSTAHRLLTTLQNERYVRFDTERSAWLIGVQAFRVGSAFVRSRDLVATARPYMRRLMEQSGETVNLAIADRGEVVYLAQVECHKMMRAIAGPGGRARLHCSGVGKAILAFVDESDARRIVSGLDLRRETPNTRDSVAALEADLATVRTRGYAIDDEETAIGLRCVASIVFDEHSEAIAALSISGPTARITDQRIPVLGEAVKAIAAEITGELGGRVPARSGA